MALLSVLLSLVGATPAAPPASGRATDGPAITKALAYARPRAYGGGRETLRMDVYRPPGAVKRRRPAIVWIHGGGFVAGDRSQMSSFAEEFARRGYVTASISYRLGGPAERRRLGIRGLALGASRDATAAVRYLRRHAGRFGLDRRRVFAAGYSAGAITALQLALRPRPGAGVSGAVAIAGATDLGSIGGRDAPVLWFHGTEDRTVPFLAARTACGLAAARGGCRLVRFPGSGHEIPSTRHERIVATMARWLARR